MRKSTRELSHKVVMKMNEKVRRLLTYLYGSNLTFHLYLLNAKSCRPGRIYIKQTLINAPADFTLGVYNHWSRLVILA